MSSVTIGMPTNYFLRLIVYGREERLNAFLLEQQLMFSDTTVLKKFINKWFRYHVPVLANLADQVVRPDIEVLDLRTSMRGWESMKDQFFDGFLNVATAFNLQWEIIWVGGLYNEVFQASSNHAVSFLSLSVPAIQDRSEHEDERLLKLYGES